MPLWTLCEAGSLLCDKEPLGSKLYEVNGRWTEEKGRVYQLLLRAADDRLLERADVSDSPNANFWEFRNTDIVSYYATMHRELPMLLRSFLSSETVGADGQTVGMSILTIDRVVDICTLMRYTAIVSRKEHKGA